MNGNILHIQATTMVSNLKPYITGEIRLTNHVGEFLWGRGSIDDKSGLIGLLYVSPSSVPNDMADIQSYYGMTDPQWRCY